MAGGASYQADMRRALGRTGKSGGWRKTLDASYKDLPLAHGSLRAAEAAIQCGHMSFAARLIDEAIVHAKAVRMAMGNVRAITQADMQAIAGHLSSDEDT